MSTGPGSPRRILALADPLGDSIALQSALRLADRYGAALEVMAGVAPPHDLSILSRLTGADPDTLVATAVERTRSALRDTLDGLAPGRAIPLNVTVGKAYVQVVRHVAETGCDFVIKKAEPLAGFDRFLFSSTDQHLLRKCPCPVWLQTATAPTQPRRILAAVDLDVEDADEPETLLDLNRRVVEAACTLAGPEAEVVVFNAWDAEGEGLLWAFSDRGDARLSADRYVNEILEDRQRAMNAFVAAMREALGPAAPRLTPRLSRGAPEAAIHDQCRAVAADVVVMGTVARTGLSGVFIGNTAENIINSLECPVLAVKPDGFVSPLLKE